jgi:hypothetical protein
MVFFFSMAVGSVEAADGMRGTNCEVKKDEVIDHDFYFFCLNLTVRGTVNGDLIGVASKITLVRGSVVLGDLWVGGGNLVVEGAVSDDIHFAGAKINITKDSQFDNPRLDVAAAAISVDIDAGAHIPGDLLVLGYQAIVDGNIGNNIDFQGQALVLNGSVGGNVDAVVGDNRAESPFRTFTIPYYDINWVEPGFTVGREAVITGNLSYEAPQEVSLRRNAVLGTYKYTQSLQQDITRAEQSGTFFSILRNYVISVIQNTVSLFLVGWFLLQFMPIMMVEPGKRVQRAFFSAFAWGTFMFVASFPIGFALIVFSIVMVVVITFATLTSLTWAATLFFVVLNAVVLGGFWFLLIFVGRAITCFIIGIAIMRRAIRYWDEHRKDRDPDDPPIFVPATGNYRWIALAIGVTTFSLIVNLPLPSPINLILQFISQALVAFSGLGAIFMYGRDLWHMARGDWLTPDLTGDRWELMPMETDVPLGMDNLPESFHGFGE